MKKKFRIESKPNFCGCGGKKIFGKKQGCCSPIKTGGDLPDVNFGPGDDDEDDK